MQIDQRQKEEKPGRLRQRHHPWGMTWKTSCQRKWRKEQLAWMTTLHRHVCAPSSYSSLDYAMNIIQCPALAASAGIWERANTENQVVAVVPGVHCLDHLIMCKMQQLKIFDRDCMLYSIAGGLGTAASTHARNYNCEEEAEVNQCTSGAHHKCLQLSQTECRRRQLHARPLPAAA